LITDTALNHRGAFIHFKIILYQMRNPVILLIVIALSFFTACGPVVTFDEPQPAGADDITHFPRRFHGTYLSESGQSSLSVSETSIIRTTDYDLVIHPSQLDSNQKISGDTLTDIETNDKTIISFAGDSILIPVFYTDTLFMISEVNVLRKFRGHHFLNILHEKAGWEVLDLTLSKGKLVLSEISSEGFANLKEIMETPADTLPSLHITPARRQFREAVNEGVFDKKETFFRFEI
jgi:hypothetical protein